MRDLVTAGRRAWSVDAIAATFMKAPKDEVEDVLESFAALGLVVSYETKAGRRWKIAGPATG